MHYMHMYTHRHTHSHNSLYSYHTHAHTERTDTIHTTHTHMRYTHNTHSISYLQKKRDMISEVTRWVTVFTVQVKLQ